MKFPVISSDSGIQTAYEAMRRDGQSHNIAEMLALRRTPFLMTDSVWNEGRINGNCFAESKMSRATGDRYKRMAKRAGVSITGKTYMPSLARFPGDPQAWVSDRGEVIKRIEGRPGWKAKVGGTVAKGRPLERDRPSVDVNEELVQEAVADELEKQPGQKVKEVREKVKNRLRPHWKKKQT